MKMDDKGCITRIFGGFVKGIVIGGIFGGLIGLHFRLPQREVIRISANTGIWFGTLKMIIDPETWGDEYPGCNGQYQSPININVNNLIFRQISRPLKWHNMEMFPTRMNLKISSDHLGITPDWKSQKDVPYVTGGPLNETYYLQNVHFHWNTDTNLGSEHAVNGKRYPMEIHSVYTSNPEGKMNPEDRLLVIAFMVSVNENGFNKGFEPIINEVVQERSSDHDLNIKSFPLKQLKLSFCTDYVIYSGSLTTPPCTQPVTWIISSETIKLSRDQFTKLMSALRKRYPGETGNNRPVQPVNGRKLFYVIAPSCRNIRTISPKNSPFFQMLSRYVEFCLRYPYFPEFCRKLIQSCLNMENLAYFLPFQIGWLR